MATISGFSTRARHRVRRKLAYVHSAHAFRPCLQAGVEPGTLPRDTARCAHYATVDEAAERLEAKKKTIACGAEEDEALADLDVARKGEHDASNEPKLSPTPTMPDAVLSAR